MLPARSLFRSAGRSRRGDTDRRACHAIRTATSDRSPVPRRESSPWARAGGARAGSAYPARHATAARNVWPPITRTVLPRTPVLALDMYEMPITSISAACHSLCRRLHEQYRLGRVAQPLCRRGWQKKPHTVDAPTGARCSRRPDLLVIDARLADDATTVPVGLARRAPAPPDRVDEIAAACHAAPSPRLLRLGIRDRRDCAQAARTRIDPWPSRRHRHLAGDACRRTLKKQNPNDRCAPARVAPTRSPKARAARTRLPRRSHRLDAAAARCPQPRV